MRIILYTGKGGVGKTSIAAATARFIAKSGKKVLIMSTDPAHSLGDSFDLNLSSEITKISDNLYAVEINPIVEGKKAWGNLQDYLKQIIVNKSNGGLEAQEALMFPGLDELFSLLFLLDRYEENYYDVIIVDCAPTGETLSMLSYSEKLQVLADKIIPMIKNVNSAIGSLIAKKTSVPKPRDIVFDELSILLKRLECLQMILHDRRVSSVRLVMTAERIPIDEARRSYTWLQLYDFGIDAVYINKIYPKSAFVGYFDEWENVQRENIKIAEESFVNQKVFRLELQEEELRGKTMLDRISKHLYKDIKAEDIFCDEEAFHITEEKGTKVFIVNMPFADIEDISVEKEESDLILSFKNKVRRFHLPDSLRRREISDYSYVNGSLRIKLDY